MFRFLLLFCLLAPVVANANQEDLVAALQGTYSACVGIDDDLADLKKMAGINTAVTAVGTAAGAGALVAGVKKTEVDKEIQDIYKQICDLGGCNAESIRTMSDSQFEKIIKLMAQAQKTAEEKNKAQSLNVQLGQKQEESKKLGNWRTGLMAGNTLTNVAGAVVASKNKVDADLQTQIDSCKEAVKNLKLVVMQARIDGVDVTEAENIINKCGEYDYVDVSKINNRAKGATVSSVLGATTGAAGTIASVVANKNNIGKNLDGAANVLAGASTVASGVATVFNATQIAAIKKVADVAAQCTEVLK